MNRTRIKFCGTTRVDDALMAVGLGVDAIGLVFTRRSPRFVDLPTAQAIVAALPPFVATVGLFMDDEAAWVREVERVVTPTWLQFHGNESDSFCACFTSPHVKAIAMGGDDDVAAQLARHPHARAWLLDSHAVGDQGGSGRTFDWNRVPPAVQRPLILAGGLSADNVAQAINRVHPWAVDVSSGIESAPGIKDAAKCEAFVRAVRQADAAQA